MTNPHLQINRISRADGDSAVPKAAYRGGETIYDYGLSQQLAPSDWSPEMLEKAARRVVHLEEVRAELERQKAERKAAWLEKQAGNDNHAGGERSAVEAAAYRAGADIADKRRRKAHSYTHKEGVIHSEILVPEGAPEWASRRERLWNEAEAAEDKSTRWQKARVAFDFTGSLPRELSIDEGLAFARTWAQKNFVRWGLVADLNVHNVKARDGKMNPHIHIMVTTREVDADGFGKKARWLDREEMFGRWRNSWEVHQNRALEAAGAEARISMESYAARGIDRETTQQLGPEASGLEKKGIRTRQGDENRRIMADRALKELHDEQQVNDTGDAGASHQLREERSETEYADTAIALEEERRGKAQEARTQARDAARVAAQHEPAREQLRRERSPLWADFSARVSAGTDAARGAVHRFRQREHEQHEDAMRSRLAFIRVASAKVGAYLVDQWHKWKGTTVSDPTRPSWREQIEGTQQTPPAPAHGGSGDGRGGGDGRDDDMQARLNRAQAASLQSGQGLVDSGVRPIQDSTDISSSHTPSASQGQTTDRYAGINLDGNDTPRQGPGTPPAGLARGGSSAGAGQSTGTPNASLDMAAVHLTDTRAEDMAARLSPAGQTASLQAANTILQQNQVTVQDTDKDKAQGQETPPQKQKDASAGQSWQSIFDKYGGKENVADKNLHEQKHPTQEREL